MKEVKSVNEIPATVQPAEIANLSLTTAELDNTSADYFVNIGLKTFASQIYFNELSADFANESVSECLNRFKIIFGNITPDQKEGLAATIGRSFCSTEKLLRIATAITMPSQLILGLMLTRLKELTHHGEFTDLAAKHFPDLSKKTMNNYMNAARILDFAGFETYLPCCLTVLTKL